MKEYGDKIPLSIKNLIEKDISKLGMAIQKDPENKVKLAYWVKKLDKDQMKIGESIYSKLNEKEIEERERKAAEMPPDEEVVLGLRDFLKQASEDVVTFGEKIEVELKERLIKLIDIMSKLLDEKPLDKSAIEKTAE